MAIYVWREEVMPEDMLCFTANTAGSYVQLNKSGSPTAVELEYSINDTAWNDYTIGNAITLDNVGDKVYMRNKSETPTRFSTSDSDYYRFTISGKIRASGDCNYLLCKNSTTSVSDYCFCRLFKNNYSTLLEMPDLPATTLGSYCYSYMFDYCQNLTTAKPLVARTLQPYCYQYMFRSCTQLLTPPRIQATTVANYCCQYMFYDCRVLEALPNLYATKLATYCYYQMFSNCSKIKVSSTQTGAYQTPYRIPTSGTGTTASNALSNMFISTGGSTSTPSINTTYYTSNTVV